MKYPPTNGQADPDRRAAAPHSDRARGIERPAGSPPGSPGEGSRGARRRLEERNPRPARRGEALPRGLPALPAGPAEEDVPQAPRAHREQAPALRDRALLAHARQGGPAALPQRVAIPRRARRSPRRRFDGDAARDRHGRRVQGRAASVGAPLREGDPRAPSRAAPGFLARRQARASVGRGAARGRGAAALNRSTHGGAVVFKLTGEGPRYLLVDAAGTRDRWVFPKGHVEKGETAAATALREVTEEAGVRARPIRRLRRVEQKHEGEWISIAYFLIAYAGRATSLEKPRHPL